MKLCKGKYTRFAFWLIYPWLVFLSTGCLTKETDEVELQAVDRIYKCVRNSESIGHVRYFLLEKDGSWQMIDKSEYCSLERDEGVYRIENSSEIVFSEIVEYERVDCTDSFEIADIQPSQGTEVKIQTDSEGNFALSTEEICNVTGIENKSEILALLDVKETANQCSSSLIDDQLPNEPLKLTIVNNRATPVWLMSGTCGYQPTLTSPGDSTSVEYGSSSYHSCQEALAAAECRGGTNCISGVQRLAPGASHVTSWNGSREEWVRFNPQCEPESDCTASCYVRRTVDIGEYKIAATGVFADCLDNGCDDCLFGEADSVCFVPVNSINLGQQITLPVKQVQYPDALESATEIVWQVN